MSLLADQDWGVLLDASGAPILDAGTIGSRTAEQICDEWQDALMPHGDAWPRSPGSNLRSLLMALAITREALEADIALLKNEISPATSTLLLADYHEVLGPDPLGRDASVLTTAQLQQLLGQRWTASGGQSLSFYQAMAASYGVSIEIEEPEPAICGVAVCGASVCSQPTLRFAWFVDLSVDNADLRAAINENSPSDTAVFFRVNGNWVN